MGKQKNSFLLKPVKGQSTVEYILLLLVVSFLGFAVIRSDKFKDFFGKDSTFFKVIAKQIQYSYRHGRNGTIDELDADVFDYSSTHATYKNDEEQTSRFFSVKAKYPSE